MSDKRKPNKKVLILITAAIVAAVCGYLLLSAPSRERAYVERQQEALIEDIMQDINSAEDTPDEIGDYTEISDEDEAEADLTGSDLDDTDSTEYNGNDNDDEANEHDHDPLTIAVYEPIFADPIPDNAFPADIVGIGILTIESINLRLPIAEGIEYASLRIAPGRVPQTARIGEIGNAVIAGHRNYAFGSMFNRLGEIGYGDIMQYQARNGELMEFSVFEIAVIEPEDQIAFLQPLNESIITLYTCTPIRSATHRLIIRAQRVG
jgi:sortase A